MERDEVEQIVENVLQNLKLAYDSQDHSVNLWYNGYLITWCSIPEVE